MTKIDILNQRYYCRTKDLLWYRETKTAIYLMIDQHRTMEEIRSLALAENIFNAASVSRSKEIERVVLRRIEAVDEAFLSFFYHQNTQTQLQLCIAMVMLTDHSFYEFMDSVYREKLIRGELVIKDSDIIAFFHRIQEKDEKAAGWTDAGIRKARDNYKSMLKEAGMISETGTSRKIIRPIIGRETAEFLKTEGLDRINRILAGERE